jgi:hypothetical protein
MKLTTIQALLFVTLSALNTVVMSQSYDTYPTIPGSLNSTVMNDVGFDNSNRLWINTASIGTAVYDSISSTWWMLNSSNGLPSDTTYCISFRGSESWIGTSDGAVQYSGYPTQGGAVINTYTIPQLPANAVTDILTEATYVWFGTNAGLARLEVSNNSWSYYTLVNDSITKIMRDGSGNLWVGTRNGLCMTSDNGITWSTYTASSTNNVISSYIYDLEYDIYGRVWISSGSLFYPNIPIGSVSYFRNNTLKAFRLEDFEYGYASGFYMGRAINFAKDNSGRVLFINSNQNPANGQLLNPWDCDLFTFQIDPILAGFTCSSSGLFGYIHEIMPNGKMWRSSRRTICPVSFDYDNYLIPITQTVLPIVPLSNTCANCAYPPTGMNEFDVNLVRTTILSGGDMHWDLSNAKYEVPKGSGKHSVFASSHWIGGIDPGGQVRVAAQTYRQTGNDFWPGPLDEMSMAPGDSTSLYFDRVYKVNRWEIEEFKNNFQNGTISYQPCNNNVAMSIVSWPAKGNGLVTGDLAPFVDVDGNGLYNPLTGGDYPYILGDQMLYKVYNDSLNFHTHTSSEPMGIELRTSVYGFLCDSIAPVNKVINYTTFYKTEMINRSNRNYSDVYFGIWVDSDLGYSDDDYVGCNVGRNTAFTYNSDANDETSSGYGLNPPIMNVKILHGPTSPSGDGIDNNNNGITDEQAEFFGMNKFLYYYNSSGGPVGNPFNYLDYYNYLRGRWLNNDPLTYGGGGINAGSTAFCNFMYPGTSDPVNFPLYGDWSEFIAGNPAGDRRFIMSSGPFTLSAGDTVVYDFAYIFSRDSLSGGNLNFTLNNSNLDLVQSWFNNNSFPGCTVYSVGMEEEDVNHGILIYPNPAFDIINITLGKNDESIRYEITNLLGEQVANGLLTANSINIDRLQPQMYLLKLQSKNTVWITRFIKN